MSSSFKFDLIDIVRSDFLTNESPNLVRGSIASERFHQCKK